MSWVKFSAKEQVYQQISTGQIITVYPFAAGRRGGVVARLPRRAVPRKLVIIVDGDPEVDLQQRSIKVVLTKNLSNCFLARSSLPSEIEEDERRWREEAFKCFGLLLNISEYFTESEIFITNKAFRRRRFGVAEVRQLVSRVQTLLQEGRDPREAIEEFIQKIKGR